MELIFDNVNWLAIVVSAVVAFIVGMVWYSRPVFGKMWMKGNGMDPETMKSDMASMMQPMLAQAVATFLLAWVIAVVHTTGSIYFAALVALMVSAIVKSNGLWAGKPKTVIAIESGYVIVMVIVMVLVHGFF